MSRFKAEPPKLDDESTAETLDEWIEEAPLGRKSKAAPWKRFDKKAQPKHRFVVVLNDYEQTLLRELAAMTNRSMQKEAKYRLIAALERGAVSEIAALKRRHNDDG